VRTTVASTGPKARYASIIWAEKNTYGPGPRLITISRRSDQSTMPQGQNTLPDSVPLSPRASRRSSNASARRASNTCKADKDRLVKIFQKVDADSNGKLNPEELKAAVKEKARDELTKISIQHFALGDSPNLRRRVEKAKEEASKLEAPLESELAKLQEEGMPTKEAPKLLKRQIKRGEEAILQAGKPTDRDIEKYAKGLLDRSFARSNAQATTATPQVTTNAAPSNASSTLTASQPRLSTTATSQVTTTATPSTASMLTPGLPVSNGPVTTATPRATTTAAPSNAPSTLTTATPSNAPSTLTSDEPQLSETIIGGTLATVSAAADDVFSLENAKALVEEQRKLAAEAMTEDPSSAVDNILEGGMEEGLGAAEAMMEDPASAMEDILDGGVEAGLGCIQGKLFAMAGDKLNRSLLDKVDPENSNVNWNQLLAPVRCTLYLLCSVKRELCFLF